MGTVLLITLRDARWVGWNKLQYVKTLSDGTEIVIHFVGKFTNGVFDSY